jgi:hypothetical protein
MEIKSNLTFLNGTGHSLINQAEFFKDMPEQGTDDIYPAQYDMSAIHTHGISMDATVRCKFSCLQKI